MQDETTGRGVPRALPIVMIGENAYFVDVRLRQLRAVRNPGDYIDFVPENGWPWVVMTSEAWGMIDGDRE